MAPACRNPVAGLAVSLATSDAATMVAEDDKEVWSTVRLDSLPDVATSPDVVRLGIC